MWNFFYKILDYKAIHVSVQAFVSLFAQDDDLHKRSYPINSLLQGMRGLDIANETCISINENGMVAIQHQVLDPVSRLNLHKVSFRTI